MLANSPEQRTLAGFSRTLSCVSKVVRAERLSDIGSIVASAANRGETVTLRAGGLSYGDAAQCADGVVVDVSRLNRFHSVDWSRGIVCLEPGVTIRELLQVAAPRGWGPPVVPGSSSVTIGGALCFDIHGKNHRRAGGFSRSVLSFDLCTADGNRVHVTRDADGELFRATVGGMGLTGAVERVWLQLEPLTSNSVMTTYRPTRSFDEAVALLESNAEAHSVLYWGNLLNARHVDRMLGHVITTEPSPDRTPATSDDWSPFGRSLPLEIISPVYNRLSNGVFNRLLLLRGRLASAPVKTSLRLSCFPWDGIPDWNRLYGKRGFFEYQFVLPQNQTPALRRILALLIEQRAPCYLFAMKLMSTGEGFLSYGMDRGISTLLDFPATREVTALLDVIDGLVGDAGGRVHLAKDSRTSAAAVASFYGADLQRFRSVVSRVDPQGRFNSDLARRVHLRA